MNSKEQLIFNISQAIKTSGISLNELSKLSGISYNSLKNYVDKKSMPKLKTLLTLINTLNLDANQIFGLTTTCSFEKTKK